MTLWQDCIPLTIFFNKLQQNEDSNTDTGTEKESENDDNERDDDDDEELTPLATLQSTSARLKSRRKSLSKQSIKSQ